jgi:hypothetical protein
MVGNNLAMVQEIVLTNLKADNRIPQMSTAEDQLTPQETTNQALTITPTL